MEFALYTYGIVKLKWLVICGFSGNATYSLKKAKLPMAYRTLKAHGTISSMAEFSFPNVSKLEPGSFLDASSPYPLRMRTDGN